jgi:hypothetical protein
VWCLSLWWCLNHVRARQHAVIVDIHEERREQQQLEAEQQRQQQQEAQLATVTLE